MMHILPVLNNVQYDSVAVRKPDAVLGCPASEPEVVSDGSLSGSTPPYVGLSTAGIWCPNRTVPPTSLEL
eukprot:12413222-Karenia_brevis.AAC.1